MEYRFAGMRCNTELCYEYELQSLKVSKILAQENLMARIEKINLNYNYIINI